MGSESRRESRSRSQRTPPKPQIRDPRSQFPIGHRFQSPSIRDVWQIVKETFGSWWGVNAGRLGAALAYYAILSLAPLLVVAVAVAGMVFGRQAAQGQILWQFQDLIGPEGALAVQSMMQHMHELSSGIIATVLGLLALLLGASGAITELHESLNLIWGAPAGASSGIGAMIRYRFVSFAMVLGVGFLLLVSLVLSAVLAVLGTFFSGFLPLPEFVLHLINTLVSFLGVTFLFALIYKVVPDVRIAWTDVWVGAAVTALLFSIGKSLIGLYLGKAGVGSAYGAAGSLVIVLVWVYYSAQIFYLGAQFTRTFAHRHGSRAGLPEPEPAPDPAHP